MKKGMEYTRALQEKHNPQGSGEPTARPGLTTNTDVPQFPL